MKPKNSYLLRTIAIGIMVLIAFSASVSFVHKLITLAMLDNDHPSRRMILTPSLLTPNLDEQYNCIRESCLSAEIRSDECYLYFFLWDYFEKNKPLNLHKIFVRKSRLNDMTRQMESYDVLTHSIHYDNTKGLYAYKEAGNKNNRPPLAYAGPNGVAAFPDANLGRFSKPISICALYKPDVIVYEPQLHQLVRFNFNDNSFNSGPKIDNSATILKMGECSTNPNLISVAWMPPVGLRYTKVQKLDMKEYMHGTFPGMMPGMMPFSFSNGFSGNLSSDSLNKIYPLPQTYEDDSGDNWVINEITLSGKNTGLKQSSWIASALAINQHGVFWRIDPNTLTLIGSVGQFDPKRFSQNVNHDYLAYNALPYFRDGTFTATAVAWVDRYYNLAHLQAFDPNGKLVTQTKEIPYLQQDEHLSDDNIIGSKAIEYGAGVPFDSDDPIDSSLDLYQFLTECLHGPAINVLSVFSMSHFTASELNHTVLLMPDSTLAKFLYYDPDYPITGLLISIFMLLGPSLALSLFLAWRVVRDGKIIGVCRWGRRCWFWGTVLFGLPMYITYRLVRPATVLVTCPTCGRGRRPDSDACHQCGAPWHPAELQIPTWRIIEPA